MDDALKLGELLKLPNLEQDTITLINQKMREFIGDVKPVSPELQQKMQNLMQQWIYGAEKEGG
ncbi:hypothetical protein [Paenibacillus lactis]|uniref:hypothetical protein n=1 Tax=Paenibacillus lactis TaxID=228574 RepID=UPI00368D0199